MLTPKDLPCIFGKEIWEKCPVRKDIAERQDPEISKWVKPTNKMLDGASELIDMFTDAMSMQYGTLASFCDVCPFLATYVVKNTNP
jgi:hypothetical protein